jgi:thiamine pyrophosphate-dependent acetolactate synthase large subunit-like protein
MARTTGAKLDRREVVAKLLANRGDLLVIAGLGAPVWDCAAQGDHPLNFYLWGAMGSAVTIGLGLALAQPRRRVLVITGDGEMLMGLGALATVAVQKPDNLAIVVLDNEHYGETGMQKTHTAFGVDLAAMAEAAGFPSTMIARDESAVARLRQLIGGAPGPILGQVKISAAHAPLVLPPRDGAYIKSRFRDALLGAPNP